MSTQPEQIFDKDYFEEQLARIRDIGSSERRFDQKITDIYSQCSADYDVEEQTTKEFLPLFRINCVGQLLSKPQRKSSHQEFLTSYYRTTASVKLDTNSNFTILD